MIQKATISLLLAVFLAVPALADPSATQAGPLPPGAPAGGKNAQLTDMGTIFIGATVVVLGVGLYLASGQYHTPGSSTPPPATTTTT